MIVKMLQIVAVSSESQQTFSANAVFWKDETSLWNTLKLSHYDAIMTKILYNRQVSQTQYGQSSWNFLFVMLENV